MGDIDRMYGIYSVALQTYGHIKTEQKLHRVVLQVYREKRWIL